MTIPRSISAARSEPPAAFDERCIPARGVAPPSNIPDILGRRAWRSGRLARLGATRGVHHGLLAAALFCAAAVPASAQSAVDQVKALEKQRFEVTVKGDYDALDKLLADDLIYVHSNGNVDNEKAFLGNLRAGRSKYKSIEPIEMNARQLGDFVFVDGRGKFQVESNGQVNDLLLTYLDVWAKRGGTWQMVHWHSARMPAPAAPAPPK